MTRYLRSVPLRFIPGAKVKHNIPRRFRNDKDNLRTQDTWGWQGMLGAVVTQWWSGASSFTLMAADMTQTSTNQERSLQKRWHNARGWRGYKEVDNEHYMHGDALLRGLLPQSHWITAAWATRF